MAHSFEDQLARFGHHYEEQIFGKPTVKPEFDRLAEALPEDENYSVRLRKLLELYGQNYLSDPTEPTGPAFNDLRLAVLDLLPVTPDEYDNLKAYSTIGVQPIDYGMGVDAYFEFKDPKTGRTAYVTLDASLNQDKLDSAIRADELISELPSPLEDESAYLEAVEKLAREIGTLLLKRAAPPPTAKPVNIVIVEKNK